MHYTLAQANAQLDILRSTGGLNETSLRNLVSSLAINASGSVTVLYSGTVNGASSGEIAKALVLDPLARVIDKTEAAKFLDTQANQKFRDALITVFGDLTSRQTTYVALNPRTLSIT